MQILRNDPASSKFPTFPTTTTKAAGCFFAKNVWLTFSHQHGNTEQRLFPFWAGAQYILHTNLHQEAVRKAALQDREEIGEAKAPSP